MPIDPHFHKAPQYYGVGGLVLFKFADDIYVDSDSAFRHATAHSALIYQERFFEDIGWPDLRGQVCGAIITFEYPKTINEHPIYDLRVISRYGDLNIEGACHKLESDPTAFCALSCRNALGVECSQGRFCSPTDIPPILPCPTTDVRCRYRQVKVGRWEGLPIGYTDQPQEGIL